MAQYSPMFLQNEILDKHAGFAAIRQIGINQVLGTDMKKHFDITSRFQVSFSLLPPWQPATLERWSILIWP